MNILGLISQLIGIKPLRLTQPKLQKKFYNPTQQKNHLLGALGWVGLGIFCWIGGLNSSP